MPSTHYYRYTMDITLLYAGPLGLWFLILSIRVIVGRRSTQTSLGDGGNQTMLRLIRGQGNFVEYTPLILILMALLESKAAPAALLHSIGAMLLAGRLLHGYAFCFSDFFPAGRFGGTLLTFISLLVASVAAMWCGIA